MILSVRNISKSFDGRRVLQQLSLDVEQGEFISIIGPSGSGKSTLFNEGDIILNEKIITYQTGFISYMPQNPSLFPWRTALENAVLGQELFGKTDLGCARELIKKGNLGEIADAYPHQLSGGMKQRIAFIRALLSPQPILCLDEPFSALDAFTRLDMQKWLLETWQSYEQSILFITHDIDEAIFLSDKIVILSSSPAEVKAIMTVPFERPRGESLRLSYAFLDFKKKVTEKITESF